MNAPSPQPVVTFAVPLPSAEPLATEKKKPGRKKKVPAPKHPISREEKEVIVYFQ